MGMHQADSLSKFNTIERETRKRIFWSLRVMDSYITTVLDLPRTLTDDETDQSYPQDADDMYITPQGIKPFTGPCLMASVNAHTRLTRILSKVRQIASGKEHDHKPNNRYQVDYAKIVEAEQDLTAWSSKLQTHTRFPDHMRREMERWVITSSNRPFFFCVTNVWYPQITTSSSRRPCTRTNGPLSAIFASYRPPKHGH
jgi:hypothetical protein